jgi:heme/copper-type cytochrome/quinol oxidase subunit 2
MNPLSGGASLESFLLTILGFVIRIGAILVALMMVYVGYKFVAAQGSPEGLKEARSMLTWTVIGALILLGAQVIATGIQSTVAAIGG